MSHDIEAFFSRFFGVFADFRVWGAFLYLLFSLATGILYFTWVVTGISLSAGLLVLIIGLPFTCLFILSVRGIGLVEGRIVEADIQPTRVLQQPRIPQQQDEALEVDFFSAAAEQREVKRQ